MPRDPERIDRVLGTLAQVWHAHPEMRLARLVQYASSLGGNRGNDVYFATDDETEAGLNKLRAQL